MIRLLLFSVVLCLVGCSTNIEVSPLQYDENLKEISLIDNPKVIVRQYVPTLELYFAKHGIGVKRVSEFAQLGPDEYGIRYSARQSWTITTYLSDAYVNVYKGNKVVAVGKFHLVGGSFCLSLSKWNRTETKMKPVLEELLKNYPTDGRE